jgi:hypothetical protein
VKKTTVYLPDDLKRRLEQTARAENRSEAEVIRSALDSFTAARPPRPTWPLVRGPGRTDIARRVDDVLAGGFGRD